MRYFKGVLLDLSSAQFVIQSGVAHLRHHINVKIGPYDKVFESAEPADDGRRTRLAGR